MGSPDPAKCVKATHRSNPDDSPVDCDADHTQSHLQAMPQRPGVLTLPMVPITNYAARVLTARAAASNTPHRPDGRAPAYLLPSLLPASPATPRCAHALAAVDDHGRTRPGSLLTALGWTASTRLACRAAGSALVLTADPQGQSLLDPQGRLRLSPGGPPGPEPERWVARPP